MKHSFYRFLLSCTVLLLLASGGCNDDDGTVTGEMPAPELLSIIPKAGYAGNLAIISGSHFSPQAELNDVTIGGTSAEVTEASATRLVITLPQKEKGDYTISVTVGGMRVEGLSFTYADEPEARELGLISVLPTKAYVGDEVLIRGTGFSATASDNIVTINGVTAEIQAATETTLSVIVPENPDGTYPFKVSVAGKSAEGLLFTYLHTPTLRIGSVSPTRGYAGSELTITGECFSTVASENVVEINGKKTVVTNASETMLKVIAPENPAGVYTIRVTVGDKTVEGASFTYLSGKYTLSTWLGTAGRDTAKACVDGAPDVMKFNMPHGLALASDNSLWIIDRGNNAIRRVDLTSDLTTTIVKSGQNGATINAPWRGSFNSKGDFYCANKGAKNILKVTSEYTASIPISGLSDPLDVQFDADDNLYIVDRGAKAVLKYTAPDYTAKSTFATFTAGPLSAAFDAAGNLVVGMNNYTVVSVAPDGTQSVLAGSGTKGSSDGTPGEPQTAQFGDMWGISIDQTGNIYITDGTYHTIRRFSPDENGDYTQGSVETIIGTAGTKGTMDGIGDAGLLNTPYDVLVSPDGKTIWISDLMNFLVRRATVE